MYKIPSTADDSVLRVVRNQTVYMEWEIHKFFDKTYVDNQYFQSPTFSLSDAEWFIQFNPKHGNNVYLILKKNGSPKDVRVSVAIGIKKGKDSAFKSFYTNRLFVKKECRWVAPAFPNSELHQWQKDVVAPNGVLSIFLRVCNLEGSLEDAAVEAACQTPSDGFETLSQNLKKLYLSGTEGDITFQVKDRQVFAHKLILAARSTVFDTMFKADMTEKNNSTVNISDSVPDHFEKFLMYMYTGELNVVSPTNASGLYYLADKYNLKKLKEVCCEILTREICVDSFCDTAVLAFLHNEAELLEAATEFFIKHANDIFPTPKWTSFAAEHFTLANELLIKMANKYCVKQL